MWNIYTEKDRILLSFMESPFKHKIRKHKIRKQTRKQSKDFEKSAIYEAKTPEPNYSEFGKEKADYIDRKGREYILAPNSAEIVQNFIRSGDIKHPEFEEPHPDIIMNWGTLIFWIRIPIHLRQTITFPDVENEWIEFYFLRDQILCRGKTGGLFVSGPKKKTGFIIIHNF